jgi:hypothetical protein
MVSNQRGWLIMSANRLKFAVSVLSLVAVALVLGTTNALPVKAGDPPGEIGVMNPTMFKCIDKDNRRVIKEQPDRFKKIVTKRYEFVHGGIEYDLNSINEILSEYPNAREESCIKELDVDYGFNPYDDKEFNSYLDRLESECKRESENGIVVPITDTRIEGIVYEFHPEDRANPAESNWFAVPSRDVMVRARGITFEIFWGSGEEGYYYFPNLGAGPIVLDLQLPRDAHAINPDVVIFSSGLEETWTVFMGFYRGDVPPPDPMQLKTPDGNFLPFVTLADIKQMNKCGSPQTNAVVQRALPSGYSSAQGVALNAAPPATVGGSGAAMPEVGGVLNQENRTYFVGLMAVLVLGVLTYAGVRRASRQ